MGYPSNANAAMMRSWCMAIDPFRAGSSFTLIANAVRGLWNNSANRDSAEIKTSGRAVQCLVARQRLSLPANTEQNFRRAVSSPQVEQQGLRAWPFSHFGRTSMDALGAQAGLGRIAPTPRAPSFILELSGHALMVTYRRQPGWDMLMPRSSYSSFYTTTDADIASSWGANPVICGEPSASPLGSRWTIRTCVQRAGRVSTRASFPPAFSCATIIIARGWMGLGVLQAICQTLRCEHSWCFILDAGRRLSPASSAMRRRCLTRLLPPESRLHHDGPVETTQGALGENATSPWENGSSEGGQFHGSPDQAGGIPDCLGGFAQDGGASSHYRSTRLLGSIPTPTFLLRGGRRGSKGQGDAMPCI